MMNKLCLRLGRVSPYYYKVNDERSTRLTEQTSNKKNQTSAELLAPYINDTITRELHKPHKQLGSYPTEDLVDGTSNPG